MCKINCSGGCKQCAPEDHTPECVSLDGDYGCICDQISPRRYQCLKNSNHIFAAIDDGVQKHCITCGYAADPVAGEYVFVPLAPTHKWTTIGEDTGPGYVVWCKECGATGRCESSTEGKISEIECPPMSMPCGKE